MKHEAVAFVGAIGLSQLLAKFGSVNLLLMKAGLMDPAHPIDWLGESRLTGVVLLNALHLYPILLLNISAALANIDPAMEEAPRQRGDGRRIHIRPPSTTKFCAVTIRLSSAASHRTMRAMSGG